MTPLFDLNDFLIILTARSHQASLCELRPDSPFARHTQTDTDLFASAIRLRARLRPGRPAEAKTAVAARGCYRWLIKRNILVPGTGILPDGHFFLPDKVVRKKYYIQQNAKAFSCSLRLSARVCGSFIYYFTFCSTAVALSYPFVLQCPASHQKPWSNRRPAGVRP